ncbi:MAG: c-type cytochrome biogenesis protein CcsB [Bacillota bacterium]|nr:c-type cytochrome biogenesis protein CcsB [Bacillota bacterium]
MLRVADYAHHLTIVLAWLAFLLNALRLKSKGRSLARYAFLATLATWVALTAFVLLRGWSQRSVPFLSLFESLSTLSWVVLSVYLVVEWKVRWSILSLVVLGGVGGILIYASTLPRDLLPLLPVLQSRWLMVHVLLNFLAYGSFTLAFVISVLYLWQERQLKRKRVNFWYYWLPSLEKLEAMSDLLIRWAFPLLTLGILTGSIYAENAWGSYWDWNVKETWSLITWLIYAGYLHARHIQGWHGRRAILLSVLGFLAILFNYLGISLLLPSPHSFIRIL